jgi:hypothetical protein
MDCRFNFVSIACAGQYVNMNQIDKVECNFCLRTLKPGRLEAESSSFPARNKDLFTSISSEPECRSKHGAATAEILNELVVLLVITEVPVGQQCVAPAKGISHARHPLPGGGG